MHRLNPCFAALSFTVLSASVVACTTDQQDPMVTQSLSVEPTEISAYVNASFSFDVTIERNSNVIDASYQWGIEAASSDESVVPAIPTDGVVPSDSPPTVVTMSSMCATAGTAELTVTLRTAEEDAALIADSRPTATLVVTCVPSGMGGTGGTGAGGSGAGGTGAGGTGGVSIPPGTTDCMMDADGCLVGGETTCAIHLDQAIAGPDVAVDVIGTLLSGPASSAIGVYAFGENSGYEPTGSKCAVSRAGTAADAALVGNDFILQERAKWSTPDGDYDATLACAFDNAAGSASMSVSGVDAPLDPLTSADMGTGTESGIVVTAWRATICNIATSAD